MRWFWMSVGFVALALGAAGAVLPLLPATPFLLLAAFAFAKSSPFLHHWLVTHKVLGPPIRNWQAYGAIGFRAKASAIIVMLLTLAASVWMAIPSWIIALQAIAMSGSALFILTRPFPPDTKRCPLRVEDERLPHSAG
ncbi:MAG TPA: DUF454 domain-containing protein [Alphaproteobacteria bacterium]|nr:DUF454 domain-containing protein [Alphaproteobacteria bacterium]HAJ48316.1 DUF454 domain-containing protein [Alphaproteobacteria bacterium]